ncbi:na[+]-dependent inorganic phosphate cotransporter isoform X3 [Lycorma delicatula]|uniref:na[+]-dependent inorganic phosphate cotransporter isoform X3 n=1 Tax=Lycorma delicatula TaxID=130591 RepID=UPI003F51244D
MLARNVLWYVVFVGFGINYMHRIHINIILVGMIKNMRSGNGSLPISECTTQHSVFENQTAGIKIQTDGFDWDERQQNYILGSFFWLHWLTQIPGGMLARHFGTKKVFGLSNFLSCLITFCIPTAAFTDFRLLVFLRVLQGFITGVAWPSMHHLTANWIPPNERSKFVSSYLGSSVGVALTYPLCGYVIDMLDWKAAFYTTGFIGVIWYICWLWFVFDTPALHPRISAKEREYIQNEIGQVLTKRELPVPWKDVLLSRPLWMVAISQWGGIWGFYTLMIQTPTYFRNVLGWDIKKTGILSGIPHLSRWLFSFGSAIVADCLLKKKILSRTNVRKLATSSCTLVQGFMILGLALSGCNGTLATLFMIAAVGVTGAVSSGPLACVVDLSPNFATNISSVAEGLFCDNWNSFCNRNFVCNFWRSKCSAME